MTQSPETSQTPFAALIVGLLALLLSAGCGGGSGQGLDEDGNLLGGAKPDNVVGASGNPNSTLAWVRDNVFALFPLTPSACSTCHAGASAPFGVDWTASHICANVGRQSGEMSALKEIESGNPDASYMIWKIQGAGPNGAAIAAGTGQMPLGGPFLPAATIQNMRDWIADGALGC